LKVPGFRTRSEVGSGHDRIEMVVELGMRTIARAHFGPHLLAAGAYADAVRALRKV